MIQFLAKSTRVSEITGCRRSFPRHLLHRITTLALWTLVAIFAQTLYTASVKAESTVRPNVVFILADDLGWSDTTLFGTTSFYETPNIERLAARGMTFTRAYSASPLCSPTRASILTGLSPARHGITSPNCHLPNRHPDRNCHRIWPGKSEVDHSQIGLTSEDGLPHACRLV